MFVERRPGRAIRCHRLVCKKQWPRVAVTLQAMTCTADCPRYCTVDSGGETTLIFQCSSATEDAMESCRNGRPPFDMRIARKRHAAVAEEEPKTGPVLVRGIETRLRRRPCAPTSQVSQEVPPALGGVWGLPPGDESWRGPPPPCFTQGAKALPTPEQGLQPHPNSRPRRHWLCP